VAGSDWRDYDVIVGPGHPMTLELMDKLYDTLIEVVDPNTGRLIASQRLPFYNRGFVGENVIARRRMLESGLIVIDIWQLALTR
jgi:hypothetical protein